MQRASDKLRRLTGAERGSLPIGVLIGQVNDHLRGWGSYFAKGYPRRVFHAINGFVCDRLVHHLMRQIPSALRKV